MKMKKMTALLLALAMIVALGGCGAQREIEAAEDAATPLVADTVAAEAEVTAEALDFAAAYAAYDPDTVVFYVEGVGVTWQELFYQVVFYASYLAAQEGKTITSWDDPCSLFVDTEGNPVSYGVVVLNNAINTLLQYHIMENHMNEAGVVLGKEALDAVDQVRADTIETSFGGDEAAFLEYLESVYCTESLWNWFNQVDALYSYDGFEHFYGENGSLISDSEVMAYANGDEVNGAWTEYVQLKLICLYDEEETAEEDTETEEASAEASEEPVAEKTMSAEDILVEILTAEDREATFDALYAQYNEETMLDSYPQGWCVYQGDVNDAIYQSALSMEIGECTLISLDGGDAIVMKLPVDPDGGVYYDSATDTMYTLRYYAAWQAYAEMISGTEGWLATGAATSEWAEGFESFTLASVF